LNMIEIEMNKAFLCRQIYKLDPPGIFEIDHPGTNSVHGDPILPRYDSAHFPGLSKGGTLSFHSQNPIHNIQIRDSPAIKIYKEFRQSFYVSGKKVHSGLVICRNQSKRVLQATSHPG